TWSLVATDSGRHDRLHLGVFEIRHQSGRLVLSRGAIRLLEAPLADAPQEVFLEGGARFSSFSMYRCDPMEWSPPVERRVVHAISHPAERVWRSWDPQPEGDGLQSRLLHEPGQEPWETVVSEQVQCRSADDGGVLLTAEMPSAAVTITSPLESRSMLETIELRVDDAEPGTGIILGDGSGHPVHRIGFFRDRTTGRTVVRYAPLQETAWETTVNSTKHPPAFVTGPFWLRVVVGRGGLKLAISGDGLRWSPAWMVPERAAQAGFRSVGLYLVKSDRPRRVRLGRVTVRELSGVAALAPQKTRDRVQLSDAMRGDNSVAWLDAVISGCPADVALSEWLRASAIRSMERDVAPALSEYLLGNLLRESAICCQDLTARRRFLDDLCLVSDVWPNEAALKMYREYGNLCDGFWRREQPGDFLQATETLLHAPVWSSQPLPAPFANPRIRGEILNRVYARQWQHVYNLSREIRFWVRSANPASLWKNRSADYRTLVEWAELVSARAIPGIDPDPILDRNREWNNPFETRVTKEGYNVMAEFDAALAGGAMEDACAIIASAGQAGVLGLLPSAADRELFVSLPKAVAVAVRNNPELKQTLVEKIGPVGVLNVRQAIARADLAAVQAATIQYYATQAAAEAHRWLGDRALSSGRFEEAITEYRAALVDATRGGARDIDPRLNLALAMLGRQGTALSGGKVVLGTREYSAGEFAELTSRLRASHGSLSPAAVRREPVPQRSSPVPAPGDFTVAIRGRFEGSVGRTPNNAAFQYQDWPGRQLAAVADQQQLYVSNRFQVTAYKLNGGQKSWSVGLGADQGEAHHWPSVPARPLIVGDRVLVRRFLNAGPELASFDAQTGKILWRTRPEKHVASDPVWLRQRIYVLTTAVPESNTIQLDLTCLDPETGKVISRKPLIRLRDVWQQRPICTMQRIGEHLLCIAGNAVLSCDAMGQVEWSRRGPFVPRIFRDASHLQDVVEPLLDGGHLFLAPPDLRTVCCLDPTSGREIWSRTELGIKRIIGLSGDHVVLQTDAGLQALDRMSGDVKWSHPVVGGLLGTMCD
ncbi:MAG: PQQ-binding-like beta-propeller repeat protein, partial [Planctomycetaceae bacterium]